MEPEQAYLPGSEVNHDHEGGSSRVRPFHCTTAGLTPTITPNVGNSRASFLLVGDCVRAIPLFLKIFISDTTRADHVYSLCKVHQIATKSVSTHGKGTSSGSIWGVAHGRRCVPCGNCEKFHTDSKMTWRRNKSELRHNQLAKTHSATFVENRAGRAMAYVTIRGSTMTTSTTIVENRVGQGMAWVTIRRSTMNLVVSRYSFSFLTPSVSP